MTRQTTTAVSLKNNTYIQLYLRSPTNNILTSLRILPGVDRLGGRVVCETFILLSGWRVTASPGLTSAWFAYYVRIRATVCASLTHIVWRQFVQTVWRFRDMSVLGVFFFGFFLLISPASSHSRAGGKETGLQLVFSARCSAHKLDCCSCRYSVSKRALGHAPLELLTEQRSSIWNNHSDEKIYIYIYVPKFHTRK